MSTPSETLIVQYQVAIDLYKHEDNLNWRKLNHLLYITAALWAMVGFTFKQRIYAQATSSVLHQNVLLQHLQTESMLSLIIMVSFIGIIVCVAFGVALWYGVEYMQERKKVVMEIEEKLFKLSGSYVVAKDTGGKQSLKKSPTTTMLKLMPIFIALIWTVVGGMAFLLAFSL